MLESGANGTGHVFDYSYSRAEKADPGLGDPWGELKSRRERCRKYMLRTPRGFRRVAIWHSSLEGNSKGEVKFLLKLPTFLKSSKARNKT